MADFSLSRSTRVQAPSGRVHALVDDFREWPKWSPWEGLDPDLEREYGGPHHGVGSTYHWSGNKKAGEGTMRITESTPTSVVVDLQFLKPFKARNVTTFTTEQQGDDTLVRWSMTGPRTFMTRVMGIFSSMDKMIGPDFEKGLDRLKADAEAG